MPISLLEALAVGAVPVCTPVGGIPNAVIDGENGFLSTDNTEAAYYEAMKRFLETDMMNYFSLQQILSQLMDSKFIKPYKDSGREYYCLTQKGLETLEYFLNRIPESYAIKIDEYIKNNKESLLADTQVKSSFVKQSENEFIVNLRVIENQSNLIDLNLNVSSEKQAKQICNNWNNNASNMYAEVINLLIRDIH